MHSNQEREILKVKKKLIQENEYKNFIIII